MNNKNLLREQKKYRTFILQVAKVVQERKEKKGSILLVS